MGAKSLVLAEFPPKHDPGMLLLTVVLRLELIVRRKQTTETEGKFYVKARNMTGKVSVRLSERTQAIRGMYVIVLF